MVCRYWYAKQLSEHCDKVNSVTVDAVHRVLTHLRSIADPFASMNGMGVRVERADGLHMLTV